MECPHPFKRFKDDISSLKHTGHGSLSRFALGCVVIVIIDCLGVVLSILIKKFFNFIQGTYGFQQRLRLGRTLPYPWK
jgi:hypothetical protein